MSASSSKARVRFVHPPSTSSTSSSQTSSQPPPQQQSHNNAYYDDLERHHEELQHENFELKLRIAHLEKRLVDEEEEEDEDREYVDESTSWESSTTGTGKQQQQAQAIQEATSTLQNELQQTKLLLQQKTQDVQARDDVLDQAKTALEEMQEELQQERTKNMQLETEVQTLQSRLEEEWMGWKNDHEAQLQVMQKEHENVLNQVKNNHEVEIKQAKEAALQEGEERAKRQCLEKFNQQLQSMQQDHETSQNTKMEELTKTQASLEQALLQGTEARAQIQSLQKDHTDLLEKNKLLQEQGQETKEQTQLKLQQVETTLEERTAMLKEATEMICTLKQRLEEQRLEQQQQQSKEALKKEQEQHNEKQNQAQKTIEAQQTITTLQEQIHALQTQLEHSQTMYTQKEQDIQSKLQTLQEELQTAKQQKQLMQTQHAHVMRQSKKCVMEYQSRLEQREAKLEQAGIINQNLREELDKVAGEVRVWKEQQWEGARRKGSTKESEGGEVMQVAFSRLEEELVQSREVGMRLKKEVKLWKNKCQELSLCQEKLREGSRHGEEMQNGSCHKPASPAERKGIVALEHQVVELQRLLSHRESLLVQTHEKMKAMQEQQAATQKQHEKDQGVAVKHNDDKRVWEEVELIRTLQAKCRAAEANSEDLGKRMGEMKAQLDSTEEELFRTKQDLAVARGEMTKWKAQKEGNGHGSKRNQRNQLEPHLVGMEGLSLESKGEILHDLNDKLAKLDAMVSEITATVKFSNILAGQLEEVKKPRANVPAGVTQRSESRSTRPTRKGQEVWQELQYDCFQLLAMNARLSLQVQRLGYDLRSVYRRFKALETCVNGGDEKGQENGDSEGSSKREGLKDSPLNTSMQLNGDGGDIV